MESVFIIMSLEVLLTYYSLRRGDARGTELFNINFYHSLQTSQCQWWQGREGKRDGERQKEEEETEGG